MATFITVAQQAITQLLAANRQQTANNRVGLVEAEERRQRVQQAQREQQRVSATQGQETPVNSSRRPLVPLDEVGAFRRKTGGVAHVFFEEIGYVENRGYAWRVFPVTAAEFIRQDSIDYDFGFYGWNMDYFVLPIGRDLCIFVVYGLISGLGEVFGNQSAAYLVSKDRVRQVQIPPKLRSCITPLNTNRYASISSINGVATSEFAPRGIREGAIGFYNEFFDREWTPVIYELLNKISPFVSSTSIRKFPAGKNPITQDIRFGAYADVDFGGIDTNIDDRSLYYAEWIGPTGLDPDLGLEFLVARRDLTTLLPSSFSAPVDSVLLTTWDWDDPAYCRQMCLALGFSPADLVA